MAVKIRLARRGRKKLAIYDVVVADARAPRDGRFIEKLGRYNPNTNPASIEINEEKALDWVLKGAKPTDTVRAMLSYRGIMLKKHLQIGVQKGAITQEEADKKFEEWHDEKEAKITGKIDSLAKKREEEKKARFTAEAKVKEARTQERLEKQKKLEASAVEAARKAAGEEAGETNEESVAEQAAVGEEGQAEKVAEPAKAEASAKKEEVSGPEAENKEDESSSEEKNA